MQMRNRLLLALCVLALGCSKIEPLVMDSAWLSRVDDSTPVCFLAIPGAHDAATGTLNQFIVSAFARTQALGIEGLWDAGVRAFDLRPALVGGSLQIYHGAISANISLQDAVDVLLGKLDSESGEFAVVVIRHEDEADSDDPLWEDAMSEYLRSLPPERVLREFSPGLTVGEMRGKILFLSRDYYAPEPVGAYINGWYSGANLERQKSASIGRGSLWVQDLYDPSSTDEKWEAFETLAEEFSSELSGDVWCINHCSAYISEIFGLPNYARNAADINGRAASLGYRLRGIIMMDFAGVDLYNSLNVRGAELIKAIISAN